MACLLYNGTRLAQCSRYIRFHKDYISLQPFEIDLCDEKLFQKFNVPTVALCFAVALTTTGAAIF